MICVLKVVMVVGVKWVVMIVNFGVVGFSCLDYDYFVIEVDWICED